MHWHIRELIGGGGHTDFSPALPRNWSSNLTALLYHERTISPSPLPIISSQSPETVHQNLTSLLYHEGRGIFCDLTQRSFSRILRNCVPNLTSLLYHEGRGVFCDLTHPPPPPPNSPKSPRTVHHISHLYKTLKGGGLYFALLAPPLII